MTQTQEELFDLRTLERYLNDGTITQEQYQAYLDSLEDCASNADHTSTQMVAHRRSRRISNMGDEDES